MLKFAMITDIHVGCADPFEGVDRKLTQYALPMIKTFCDNVSDDPQFAFAIQLGDLIEDRSETTDLENYTLAANIFAQNLNKTMYHVVGNHDAVNLSSAARGDIVKTDETFYAFIQKGYCFVVLHTVVPQYAERPIMIPDAQKEWLINTLAQSDKPTIIFCHHPLADQDLSANPWFHSLAEDCLVQNRQEIREVIRQSGKVVAVFNGHVHWNRIDIHDDIPYITLQSATENFKNDGTPAKSWAEVTLTQENLDVRVHGNDTMRLTYPINNRARRKLLNY